jgi:DNA-binding beta-propeller fold protein YncE
MSSKILVRVLAATLCGAFSAAAVAAGPGYALTSVVPLGGAGGWDYMAFDPGSAQLYIAHGTRVEVIDTVQLKHRGEIADTPGVHGVALAPELGRGFISAGGSQSVVVFDLKSLARLSEVKVTGENPDAIVYDSATQRVFTFNGRGRNATVLDARTATVIGTIALDAKPEFAVADGHGHVFVNLEDKNSLARLDSRDLTVQAVWPLSGCEEPSGLALNQAAGKLYSVCGNRVMVVTDARSGQLLGSAPIGEGADAAAYDADAQLAFASCGEGVLTAVAQSGAGAPAVAQSIATQRGARTMALDPKSHRVFLVTADYGPAPPATAEHPHPRPAILPDTFRLLVVAPQAPQSHRHS